VALSALDYLELLDITARFGHVIDDEDWDHTGDVWSDDGTFDLTNLGMWTATGIDALRERLSGAPHGVTHHATNLVVTRDDGDTADLVSKFVLVWNDGRVTRGEYQDLAVRTDRGWRLQRRTVIPYT
jgi:hypothetical protein